MRVGFLGNLKNRRIQGEVARFAYVKKNERGREEYVLVFNGHVPGPSEESRLYKDAEIKDRRDEVLLTYPGLNTEVILTTLEADDKFREEHPEEILAYETFRFDETRKGKEKELVCRCEERKNNRKHKSQ